MRSPILPAAVLVAALATTAAANMGGSPPPEPTAPPQGEIRPTEKLTSRQQAEQLYGGAYEDGAKASRLLAGGKENSARSKLKHAL